MDSLTETVQRVLEDKKDELKAAMSDQQVDDLAKDVARQVADEYDPRSDPWAYRMVIIILGFVLLVVSITYAWYTLTPDTTAVGSTPARTLREMPDALIALGSAAIGALAGLLAPAPRK